jgi:hypothetical protein
MKTLILKLQNALGIFPADYLGPHSLAPTVYEHVPRPPQGRIPFEGWIDLAEIKAKLNPAPTETGFEMIPTGHTAACGDEAYLETYTDVLWDRSHDNLRGWYPIPEGTRETWRVVGSPFMRMARRKIAKG